MSATKELKQLSGKQSKSLHQLLTKPNESKTESCGGDIAETMEPRNVMKQQSENIAMLIR